MKEIIIIPHIGIGQLKLGMAPDELEKTLLQMKRQWSNSSNEAMQMERCAETDDPNLITGRYMDNDSFFLVQYRNGKATEIGIQRDLSKVASIKLFGMDMFNTTAECIIDSLMKKDKVICNEKDLQLGTEYIFPKSGVRLWRERAFHPKLLKDPLYMTKMILRIKLPLTMLKVIANALQKRVGSNYRFVLSFNSALILLGALGILPPFPVRPRLHR